MVKRMIKWYYRFFDDKNSTSLLFLIIIAIMILWVWMIFEINNANAYSETNNISVMDINWIEYKILD